jgi:hypothetical protein
MTSRVILVAGLMGCGADSPYAWNNFGIGPTADGVGPSEEGCTGFVGFTAEDAPTELEVQCVGAACACVADGEAVGEFEDERLCDDWQKAMDGSAGRQDRMVAYAVEQCGV